MTTIRDAVEVQPLHADGRSPDGFRLFVTFYGTREEVNKLAAAVNDQVDMRQRRKRTAKKAAMKIWRRRNKPPALGA